VAMNSTKHAGDIISREEETEIGRQRGGGSVGRVRRSEGQRVGVQSEGVNVYTYT